MEEEIISAQENIVSEDKPVDKKELTDEEKRFKALNDYIEKLKLSNDYSDSYNVRLDSFEGPIDLLLHLVKAAKIRIEDIFVSAITEQYMKYMEQIDSVDLEKASDFIEVAAILLEIKSKSILPNEQEEDDENSAKRELIQRIEEYKLYKEACEKMKEKETVGAFYKDPDASVGDSRIILKDMNMDGLVKALQKLFLKMEQRALTAPQRKITLDRFTVAEKITHIKDALTIKDETSFFELFEADYTKSEIITTFQALLELLKMQFMHAEQKEIFGDIILKRIKRDDDAA